MRLTSFQHIQALIVPRMRRKAAEMEVPMMLPILLKEENLLEIAEEEAATMREVMRTILGIRGGGRVGFWDVIGRV